MRKTSVVWLGALTCCLLWGSAFPCVKIGYALFAVDSSDTAGQILFAGCRFTLAGALAILLGSLLERRALIPKRSSAGNICKLSLLQTVGQYVLFYIGLARTTGVKASILEAVNVFVAILIAGLLFHQETLSVRKFVGCGLGFAGVVLVNLTGGAQATSFTAGDACILLSTVAYAFSSVLLKEYGKTEDPVALSGWQFLLGGAVMAALGLLCGGRLTEVTGRGLVMLVYLAMISSVAYSVWGLLLKYNPLSRIAVFGFMNPTFGVILSALLLREGSALSASSLGALALVCAGIWTVNRTAPPN